MSRSRLEDSWRGLLSWLPQRGPYIMLGDEHVGGIEQAQRLQAAAPSLLAGSVVLLLFSYVVLVHACQCSQAVSVCWRRALIGRTCHPEAYTLTRPQVGGLLELCTEAGRALRWAAAMSPSPSSSACRPEL